MTGTHGTVLFMVLLALTMGLVTLPATSPQGASAGERYPVPTKGTYQLAGRGYGHGIGMSQFGAEGMGRLGKSYRQILRFYFPGTSFESVAPHRRIRVLLSGVNRYDGAKTFVVLRHRRALQLVNRGTQYPLPDRVGGVPVSGYRVVGNGSGLSVVAFGDASSKSVVEGLSGRVRISTAPRRAGSRVTIVSAAGGERTYRGFLDVRRSSSGLTPISSVLLEDYLRSVVASEVPSSWTAAALRAQAVAARSYALLAQVNARAAGRAYDICDTTYCQAYGSIGTESGPETDAVRDTAGRYLASGGQPALTMFSSANGGQTVSGSYDYLVAKHDPYDGVVSGDANWGHRWRDTVSAAAIESAWPSIGTLRGVRVVARDGNGKWGGRIQRLAVVGSKDAVRVSGDSFRWALGLKSTWWTMTNVT